MKKTPLKKQDNGRFVKGHTRTPKTSVPVTCPTCTTIFMVQPHRFFSGRGKFCSRKCKRFTDETKKIMSENRKGKPTGKTGDKCHFWKGGVTPINKAARMSLESRNWRSAIFKRDNYTCVMCKKIGGKIQADHIKPFSSHPELRFDLNNGRTLCIECHKMTDTYGGKLNKKHEKNKIIKNW